MKINSSSFSARFQTLTSLAKFRFLFNLCILRYFFLHALRPRVRARLIAAPLQKWSCFNSALSEANSLTGQRPLTFARNLFCQLREATYGIETHFSDCDVVFCIRAVVVFRGGEKIFVDGSACRVGLPFISLETDLQP